MTQFSNPANRRQQNKAATQAAVLAAARAEFAARGYEAATIRDIARRAGRSTGAIFNTWRDKAELYHAAAGHPAPAPGAWAALQAAVEAYHLSLDRERPCPQQFHLDVAGTLGRMYVPGAAAEREAARVAAEVAARPEAA